MDHDLPHGSISSMNHRHQHDLLMFRPSSFKGFSRKISTTLDSLMGRDYRWISSRDMIFTSLTMQPTLVTGMNSLFLYVPQRAWWWPWPWPLRQPHYPPRMHRGLQGLDSWSSLIHCYQDWLFSQRKWSCFWARIFPCSPGCADTHYIDEIVFKIHRNHPSSSSPSMLAFKVCSTMPGPSTLFYKSCMN